MKKCMYCSSEIPDSSVLDVCNICGVQVWGEKMFSTILENMEDARASGDLFQGTVSQSKEEEKTVPAQTQQVTQAQSETPIGQIDSENTFNSL